MCMWGVSILKNNFNIGKRVSVSVRKEEEFHTTLLFTGTKHVHSLM
jgi:hypothetical protein